MDPTGEFSHRLAHPFGEPFKPKLQSLEGEEANLGSGKKGCQDDLQGKQKHRC